jgi:hypothetical protein
MDPMKSRLVLAASSDVAPDGSYGGETSTKSTPTTSKRLATSRSIGDDFFQTELAAVAQNGDEGDEHRDLP